MLAAATFAITPVDTARAVAQVYTWSLLATIPLLLAWVASLLLARAAAQLRVLAWRGGIVAVAVVLVAQFLPVRWVAGVLPEPLAVPLVALGRIQVGEGRTGDAGGLLAVLALAAWALGVLVLLARAWRDWRAVARVVRDATPLTDPAWLRAAREARATLGLRRAVLLVVADGWPVPATFGILRPVILVPRAALDWDASARRALLLHELAHVQAGDVGALMLGRMVRALCWVHPLAWLVVRRLRAECELACDERVLAARVARSDYAALLLRVADSLHAAPTRARAVMAMADRAGLAARVHAIADSRCTPRVRSRGARPLAAVVTLAVALPTGALRPAPTRGVLTTLMHDTRWEARAYAVIGLAQRADSVEIARAAALRDPSARVRALASSAIARSDAARRGALPLRD